MTNNKSESGDSLRKQEEKCDCWRTGDKCDNCPKVATSEKKVCQLGVKGCDIPYNHAHGEFDCEVATSEKENVYDKVAKSAEKIGKLYNDRVDEDYRNSVFTPHESEDWSEKFAEFGFLENDRVTNKELKEFIKQVESKAYQRGREERQRGMKLPQVLEIAMEARADERKKMIQEIEKEKKLVNTDTAFRMGVRGGLDKAKSIISGLMKK